MGDPLSAEPLRIHHVVSDVHRQDSGTSYVVVRLAEALTSLGSRVDLHALEPRPEHEPDVDITYYPRSRLIPRLGISAAMRSGLRSAAQRADIMHVHGLWTMPTVYPSWATRGTTCTVAISPHGMLEPWARNWHSARKDAFSLALQRRVLDRVDLFHATAASEAEAIRDAGHTAPIVVIPVGIDLPDLADHSRDTGGPRRIAYLGRLHPKKNLEALIEAWVTLSSRHPDWTLTIAGPGDPTYEMGLRRLAAAADRITMPGQAYGPAKAALLRNTDLFVLPSHSENFGVVVAEALSYGVPVIATVGTPWQGLVTERCGWWTQPTAAALAGALDEAMALDDEDLSAIGQRGREWMERDFGWETVADMMETAYRWACGDGTAPPFARLG